MRVGAVVGASLGAYANAFGVLLGLAAIQIAPNLVRDLIGTRRAAAVAAISLVQILVFFVVGIPAFVVSVMVSDSALQDKPQALGPAFECVGRVFWRFLGWSLAVGAAIAGLVVVGALAVALVPKGDSVGRLIGISIAAAGFITAGWLVVRWSLLGPVVVLESAGSTGPLIRSTQLVKGQFWRVVGALVLLGAFSVPGIILVALGSNLQTREIVRPAAYWLGTILEILALPVASTGMVAIYRSLAQSEGATA